MGGLWTIHQAISSKRGFAQFSSVGHRRLLAKPRVHSSSQTPKVIFGAFGCFPAIPRSPVKIGMSHRSGNGDLVSISISPAPTQPKTSDIPSIAERRRRNGECLRKRYCPGQPNSCKLRAGCEADVSPLSFLSWKFPTPIGMRGMLDENSNTIDFHILLFIACLPSAIQEGLLQSCHSLISCPI
jgi:hypothetical protein